MSESQKRKSSLIERAALCQSLYFMGSGLVLAQISRLF
jgi:hypothetical protein